MSFIARDLKSYEDKSIGNGQCVAFVRAAASMPHTGMWRRGAHVQEAADLPVGTVIATFDRNGGYGNHVDGRSHAAVYLGANAMGVRVLDQWIRRVSKPDGSYVTIPVPVHERLIAFRANVKPVDDGRNYYVVE